MNYVILEKAETGIKVIDKSSNKSMTWIGITEDELKRAFLLGFKISFPNASLKDVEKYFSFSTSTSGTNVIDVSDTRDIWEPKLNKLFASYGNITKSVVKPFTRIRRGHFENVKSFARAGAKKAIIMGVAAVMIAVFGLPTLSQAQTSKLIPLQSIDSSYVTEKRDNNYVTIEERSRSDTNIKIRKVEQFIGKTFNATPARSASDVSSNIYNNPNRNGSSFTVRTPEQFTILKLVRDTRSSEKQFKEHPYLYGMYEIQLQSGKKGFVPVPALHHITNNYMIDLHYE